MSNAKNSSSSELTPKEKRLARMKRILAWAGIILLAVIYLATGILGFFGSPATKNLFKAAIVCTVVVPVTLYAMLMIARILGGASQDDPQDSQVHRKQAENDKKQDAS